MGRSKGVTIRQGRSSLQVEYVKTRAVLRLRRVDGADDPGAALELPLEELTRAFGIGLRRPETCPRFLLFGGPSPQRAGGSNDLLAAYRSEDDARAAFHELRRSQTRRGGWAELVAVDGSRPPRRLCWSGCPPIGTGQDGDGERDRKAPAFAPGLWFAWSAAFRRRSQRGGGSAPVTGADRFGTESW